MPEAWRTSRELRGWGKDILGKEGNPSKSPEAQKKRQIIPPLWIKIAREKSIYFGLFQAPQYKLWGNMDVSLSTWYLIRCHRKPTDGGLLKHWGNHYSNPFHLPSLIQVIYKTPACPPRGTEPKQEEICPNKLLSRNWSQLCLVEAELVKTG